jgi:hypothetical protein
MMKKLTYVLLSTLTLSLSAPVSAMDAAAVRSDVPVLNTVQVAPYIMHNLTQVRDTLEAEYERTQRPRRPTVADAPLGCDPITLIDPSLYPGWAYSGFNGAAARAHWEYRGITTQLINGSLVVFAPSKGFFRTSPHDRTGLNTRLRDEGRKIIGLKGYLSSDIMSVHFSYSQERWGRRDVMWEMPLIADEVGNRTPAVIAAAAAAIEKGWWEPYDPLTGYRKPKVDTVNVPSEVNHALIASGMQSRESLGLLLGRWHINARALPLTILPNILDFTNAAWMLSPAVFRAPYASIRDACPEETMESLSNAIVKSLGNRRMVLMCSSGFYVAPDDLKAQWDALLSHAKRSILTISAGYPGPKVGISLRSGLIEFTRIADSEGQGVTVAPAADDVADGVAGGAAAIEGDDGFGFLPPFDELGLFD